MKKKDSISGQMISRGLAIAASLAAVWGLLVTAVPTLNAQEPGESGHAAAHAVVNFSELARQEAMHPLPQREGAAIRRMPLPVDSRGLPIQPQPEAQPPAQPEVQPESKATPPVAQLGLPSAQVPSPPTAASFQALGDDNTQIPPDTAGAVGPNHLMVMLNSQVRIQNRSGGELSTVSLDGFWSSTGASGPSQPQVVYDPFNDRWIAAAVSDRESANSSVLVGVSQSGDPTSAWNLYRYDTDATDTDWADSPMLGFNKNWIVVTVNRFTISGGSFVNSFVYIWNKSALYSGTVSPDPLEGIGTDTLNVGGAFPAVTLDNTISTMYLARVLNTNVCDLSGCSGALRISAITGTVDNPSYNYFGPLVQGLTGSPWDFHPPNYDDFAPQLGTTDKIQNGDSRLLNLVYRNGSLWAAHNAFLPANSPTHTAAQWWQFTPAGALQQFGRVEDPGGSIFYAYPSIAVNSRSDVMLGFSIFSSSQYAGAGYATRSAYDSPGTMRSPADPPLKGGEATYYKAHSGGYNLWGDYSSTVNDPTLFPNDLDFWTLQEYAASPHFSDPTDYGRWGTWWGMINPPPPLGSISWEKRKATDNTLQGGATFTLEGTSGPFDCIGTSTNPITVVDNGANDDNPVAGQIEVNNVCLDSYTVTEMVAPEGWALDAVATRGITVSSLELNPVVGTQGQDDPGTTDESDFHNRLGSISWEKRKATDNTLQGGATFTVEGTSGPLACIGTSTNPITVVDNGANDDNPAAGQIQVSNVCLDSYTVTEMVAPEGWALDAVATRGITVSSLELNPVVGTQGQDDPGTTDESDFHNRLGSISWEKRKATDNTLQGGATFEVSPNPLTGSGTLTITDNDGNDADSDAGQLEINNVLLGSYTITETVAPAAWVLDPVATRGITVSNDETNPVVGTQGQDDPGTTDESDFHDPPRRRRSQLVAD